MSLLIKNTQIVPDKWQILRAVAEDFFIESLTPEPTLIPLGIWQKNRVELMKRPLKGIWLAPSDSIEPIVADLAHFDVIAIDFPKFADGRGYSLATLLRQRYAYKNELRAIGDVLRDQLFYMARVGFDALCVRSDTDVEAALAALNDFSIRYQRTSDEPAPLFVRVERG